MGFLQNPFKYRALKRLGMVEYKNSPASPVRLIKTLPVFPNFVINLVAVSRYFMLLILERIAVVRGMLHEFFFNRLKINFDSLKDNAPFNTFVRILL